ncbi:porimin [Dendropsophus ebraccatus]|uniref:porimin n=1 Tax=Dendropsophus ebraccatus TaxID=150705 RepID=UPI003832193D
MELSVGSRGWLWTGLLLLAVSCTAGAEDPPISTIATPVTSKESSTSPVTTTMPSTTTPASNATNPNATAPAPTINTTSTSTTKPVTTPTTKGPPLTKATTTPVTTKETVKTTSVATSTSSPVTSSISASLQQRSGFDLGSFIGGIVLTLGLLAAVYFGCRFYNTRRGVRYRTIDEHEAII